MGIKKKKRTRGERNDDSSRSSTRITGRKNLINKSFFYQGEYTWGRGFHDNFQTSDLLMLAICRVGATTVENIIVTRNVIS